MKIAVIGMLLGIGGFLVYLQLYPKPKKAHYQVQLGLAESDMDEILSDGIWGAKRHRKEMKAQNLKTQVLSKKSSPVKTVINPSLMLGNWKLLKKNVSITPGGIYIEGSIGDSAGRIATYTWQGSYILAHVGQDDWQRLYEVRVSGDQKSMTWCLVTDKGNVPMIHFHK